ncbi:aspartate aminotransferase family protein [Roseovarius pacificus]|uniref:aspartate aminotransferase family protein n=1 Tax=Roseovarius pacificus TaxID=337701 RepID=UPI002A188938|nr:aspartate aminotransferase family protein [Roseovarius pacificus]
MSEKINKSQENNYMEAPRIETPPPGPQARAMLATQKETDSNVISYPHMIPLVPDEGLGATVKDVDGNYYIDLSGGVGVLNVGHSHPEVVEAIKLQCEKACHMLDFPSQARMKLTEKLLALVPGGMKGDSRVFLCGPTGSDAVEAGVKLSKIHSGKPGVISFEGGWHGVTGTGLSATGKKGVRSKCMPVMPEVYIEPYAYCYRCRFGLSYPSCDLQCAKFLEHIVRDPDTPATSPGCVLIEPIQGEGGIVVPPDGYLAEVRRICDEYGLIFIMDEIQTGFGRTGAMFASEHWDITPDLLLVSKTMGGGLPLAAVIIRNQFDTWSPGDHVGTFRGNLLSCASGLASIEVIQKNGLVERSKNLGALALDALKDIAKDSKVIGEVRGKGLFMGLEFVKDKASKEPAPEILQKVVTRCFQRGCILWKSGRWNNVGRMMPALVITEQLLMTAIEIFARELKAVEKEL